MENQDVKAKNSNKRIALILGGIALVWYVISMFTIWRP